MTYCRFYDKLNTTNDTCGARTVYPSREHLFILQWSICLSFKRASVYPSREHLFILQESICLFFKRAFVYPSREHLSSSSVWKDKQMLSGRINRCSLEGYIDALLKDTHMLF
jgi:hypothetical protein